MTVSHKIKLDRKLLGVAKLWGLARIHVATPPNFQFKKKMNGK